MGTAPGIFIASNTLRRYPVAKRPYRPRVRDIVEMAFGEHERLFKIRCASKRGRYMSPEDLRFMERMYRKFPVEYEKMDSQVDEATKPFGAD